MEMSEEQEKTEQELTTEISELLKKVVGKINSFDSKTKRANVTESAMNTVIAGSDLSRREKAGILAYLLNARIKG